MYSACATRRLVAVAGAAVIAVAMAGCSSGSGSDDGTVTIDWLVGSDAPTPTMAAAMVAAFEAENPDITVNVESRPGGTEGDNLVKTRLSTGEMSDVFLYNSGSLFEALNPDQTLVDLSDQSWVGDITDEFSSVVSTDNGTYGSPIGSTFAGAVVYNKPVYEQLGLEIPTSWDDFMANNEAIAAAGTAAPVVQTYGDTWTSQLFVLGDFANVAAADPDWASEYTANERSYTDEPALAGFQHQQDAYDAGFFNENFASATYEDGARMVATGEGVHYPILTSVIGTIEQNSPDNVDDVGVFALPADDADDTTITFWQTNANYIPTTTEGAELDAARTFIAFVNSGPGCDVQNETMSVAGPYAISSCSLPDDAPPLVQDLQVYSDEGNTGSALEFQSPIKGPNLENITVQVGSGISTASEGASLYDADVVNQARQLGLDGW